MYHLIGEGAMPGNGGVGGIISESEFPLGVTDSLEQSPPWSRVRRVAWGLGGGQPAIDSQLG